MKRVVGQCRQSDIAAVNRLVFDAWNRPENRGKALMFAEFEPQMTKGEVIAWKVIAQLCNGKADECIPYLREVLAWGNESGQVVSFEYRLFKNAPAEIRERLRRVCHGRM